MSAASAPDPLGAFDPLVARWFRERLGEPSDVQERVWRELSAGRNVLACAPTGSGKTLAAFLRALDALAVGAYPADELSVLYLSPLKALNTDIGRNLLEPLEGIRSLFEAEGRPFPRIGVSVRSGDTTPAERRAFLREPPAVLATTPESLALLLNSPRARAALSRVRLVVVDEIHALAPDKRGVFLMAQLERLVLLSGDFRRIALSATVADPAAVARYAAGRADGGSPRPISVVVSSAPKRISLAVRYPPPLPKVGGREEPESVARWAALVDCFIEAARRNRTTLVFVNSRRHAEKIAFLMNERSGEELAWAHHGSLSRDVRASVEDRLKRGLLKAVVATGSLELGIDIGTVDEVLLAGTPAGTAATLQRVGRAGHRLGAESAATAYPLHRFDLLLAAATVRDARLRRLEAEPFPEAPLDVLAQILLSMTAMDDWTADALYGVVRRAEPFASLPRTDFDLVLDMLRGRFDQGRIPALESRLDRSAPPGILRAKKGALPLLYGSGGVIADRGSFALVAAENRAPLGELDEEFVWERRLGDSFSLGTRAWRIVGIDDRSVSVAPSSRGIQIVPFWRAESQRRSLESMESVIDLIEEYESTPWSAMESRLAEDLDGDAVGELGRLLAAQEASCPPPLRGRLSVEDFPGPDGQGRYAFLHTLRGGRVNAALGIAFRAAADRRWGAGSVEFFWEDSGVLAAFSAAEDLALSGASAFPALFEDLRELGFSELLSSALEPTGLFGAAFRENAGRALLLPKGPFGKRTPLWMTRLRSKRLYEAVRGFADFPIVRETWRTCLKDILDPEAAASLAQAVSRGQVELVFRANAAPSLFARGSVWIASGSFMYRGDEGGGSSATDEDLIRNLLSGEGEPPCVSAPVAESVVSRLKRLDPDYAPRDAAEAADWLDERLLVDADEWALLLKSLPPGAEPPAGIFRFPGAEADFVVSPDFAAMARDTKELLSRWLRSEGPVSEARVVSLFGPEGADYLRELSGDQSLAQIRVGEGPPLRCDAELASRLLRAERASRRRTEAEEAEMPLGRLQALAARLQGLVRAPVPSRAADAAPAGTPAAAQSAAASTGTPAAAQSAAAASAIGAHSNTAPSDPEAGAEELRAALEPLLGRSAPASLWERELFPARCAYRPYHLELLMARYPLLCYGASGGRIGFSLAGELESADLGSPPPEISESARALLAAVEKRDRDLSGFGRAAFAELAEAGLLGSDRFAAAARFFESSAEASLPSSPKTSRALPYGAPRSKGDFPSRARWESARAGGPAGFDVDRLRPLRRAQPADPVERESLLRERARRLLSRFGVLFRSLAALEEGAPPWKDLFRALRLMEFSGEVVGGRFVSGVEELQFRFASGFPPVGPELYCLCAQDPASICGLSAASSLGLPSRLPSTHLVWRGERLLLVSRRSGRDLEFRVPPDDSDARASLELLCARLALRATDPVFPLAAETLNGEPSRHSPYARILGEAGFVESLKGLEFVVGLRRS